MDSLPPPIIRPWGVWLILSALALVPVHRSPAADGICPVHGLKMEKSAPILYGMPNQAEFEEMKIGKTKFSFDREYRLGGCIIGPDKTATIHVCQLCVAARTAWLKSRKSRR